MGTDVRLRRLETPILGFSTRGAKKRGFSLRLSSQPVVGWELKLAIDVHTDAYGFGHVRALKKLRQTFTGAGMHQ